MYPISAETFSVQFPFVYEHPFSLRGNIMAEHRQDDKCLSYINISLQELNTFDDYEGDDLTTRFRAFCLDERGTVEVVADKELKVAGHTSVIRTAQAPNGTFYYFALLPINNEHGYLFIGDCESASKEYYEPLFDEIWQSLQYFDKPNEHRINFPPDGTEFWQISDHLFILSKDIECYISDGDGALYVKVEAEAPPGLTSMDNDIITGYDNGKVYLQFYFKGIYNSGIPTGKFHFENDRDNSYLTYVWKGGFQFSQYLTADVTLHDGWLTIDGHFNEHTFRLAVILPIDNLNWVNYRFLSAEEVFTAPAAIVHHLGLTDAAAGTLQEAIQPLTNLQVLSIDYRDKDLAADLKEVPAAVRQLSELKHLSLTGVAALETLPQWLG
ncbi:MAG TPA: hypothetical protein VIM79_17105, partial [Niastella sp.]